MCVFDYRVKSYAQFYDDEGRICVPPYPPVNGPGNPWPKPASPDFAPRYFDKNSQSYLPLEGERLVAFNKDFAAVPPTPSPPLVSDNSLDTSTSSVAYKQELVKYNLELANLFDHYSLLIYKVRALDDALTATNRSDPVIALQLADAMRDAGLTLPAMDTYRLIIEHFTNRFLEFNQATQVAEDFKKVLGAGQFGS